MVNEHASVEAIGRTVRRYVRRVFPFIGLAAFAALLINVLEVTRIRPGKQDRSAHGAPGPPSSGRGRVAAEIGRMPRGFPVALELAAGHGRCSQDGSRLSRCRGRREGPARSAGRLLHLLIAPRGLLRPDTTRLERAAHVIGVHAFAESRSHIDQGVQNGEPFCCPNRRKELQDGSSQFRLLAGLATFEPPPP